MIYLSVCKVPDRSTYIIKKSSKTVIPRGKKKINDEPIKNHIESFNSAVAHYRREHAPNSRYLPSKISATNMYKDFTEKFPEMICSYDHYRKILKNLNISFVKLGNEECEIFETYNQHIKNQLWIMIIKIYLIIISVLNGLNIMNVLLKLENCINCILKKMMMLGMLLCQQICNKS